jgi:hypothetical protein
MSIAECRCYVLITLIFICTPVYTSDLNLFYSNDYW